VDLERKLELIDERIAAANRGTVEDVTGWRRQAQVVLRTVLPEGDPLIDDFGRVKYSPSVYTSGTDFTPYRRGGVLNAVTVLEAAKTQLILQAEVAHAVEETAPVKPADQSTQVFIVHGHDEAKKHQVARVVRDLTGDEPVILHEVADEGRVLIEKFEASAGQTGYAVVILTADDLGRAVDASEDAPRGRQNVIFEMGFFFGSIGRRRVSVLLDPGVERPSDVDGLVYTPLDPAGAWKMSLAKNMEAAGLAIDWAALGKT
jgi:predicted nucleotide-binding protein